MVGIALGGLGVLTLRLPRDVSFHQLVDLPSILLAVFLVAILSLIAYFTNPSEASFRAFLTELAFRQHLSRLSGVQDGDPEDDDDDETRIARPIDYKGSRKKRLAPHNRTALQHDSPVVFHFANKASVSLRTPGYRFRSFGILTFAVVSPTELALAGAQPSRATSSPPPANVAQHGACFIGAFGHWWLALEMRMVARHVRLAAHDDTSSPAPTLDTLVPRPSEDHREHNSPPKTPRSHPHRVPPRTKAALRERLSLQSNNSPVRPTTPPPLPKSASLPLHGPPPAPPLLSNSPTHPTPAPTPPVLTDILAQIDATRAATTDLRTQLTAYRTPVPAHAALYAQVEAARETKKREDASRAAVKARTKSLDDARRQADAGKREAEKRLKAAAAARDSTTNRIECMERDIGALRAQLVDDQERVEKSREASGEERTRLESELDAKRAEVVVAEEAVGKLSGKAHELEEAIARETKKLEMLKTERARDAHERDTASVWPPPLRPPALPLGRLSNYTHNNHTLTLDTFSPFSDSSTPTITTPLSPVGASLLPSSLVLSMESPRETFFTRTENSQEDSSRWAISPQQHTPRASLPVSTTSPGLNPAAKAFTLPSHSHRRLPHDLADSSTIPTTFLSPTFPNASGSPFSVPASSATQFSTGGTPFNSASTGSATLYNDGVTPSSAHPVPTYFAALRSAFAPSPAEREALQRALEEGSGGGSANPSPPIAGRSSVVQPRPAATFNPWIAEE